MFVNIFEHENYSVNAYYYVQFVCFSWEIVTYLQIAMLYAYVTYKHHFVANMKEVLQEKNDNNYIYVPCSII